MTKPPMIKGQRGQLIVEAVLIIVVFMAITFTAAKFLKQEEFVKNLISGPWQNLAGMMQNGVWGSPAKTEASHPNGHFRHIVVEGDLAK